MGWWLAKSDKKMVSRRDCVTTAKAAATRQQRQTIEVISLGENPKMRTIDVQSKPCRTI
jgi:serine protease inhibitor